MAHKLNYTGQEIDSILDKVEPMECKKFYNTSVSAASFSSDTTYSDFPYKASIALTGVTNDMVPEIIFSIDSLNNNSFAPVAETYNGGIYIYAEEQPSTAITIPTIICWR